MKDQRYVETPSKYQKKTPTDYRLPKIQEKDTLTAIENTRFSSQIKLSIKVFYGFSQSKWFCCAQLEIMLTSDNDKMEKEQQRVRVCDLATTSFLYGPPPTFQEPATTIYVENLPDDVTSENLKGLFSTFGQLRDVFISKKRTVRQKKFGFIKFSRESDAKNAIVGLKGRSIGGKQIHLNLAKFNRQRKPVSPQRKAVSQNVCLWNNFKRPGTSFKEALLSDKKIKPIPNGAGNPSSSSLYPTCHGVLNISSIHWLQYSFVIVTKLEENIDSISERLHHLKLDYCKVRLIGSQVFLVTLRNSEQVLEIESSGWAMFRPWRWNCLKWNYKISMYLRVVRVVIKGLPWQAWSLDSVANALKDWGEPLCIENDINETEDLSKMFVLVLLEQENRITQKMFCTLDHGSVLILLEEVEDVLKPSSDFLHRNLDKLQSAMNNAVQHAKSTEKLALIPKAAVNCSRIFLGNIEDISASQGASPSRLNICSLLKKSNVNVEVDSSHSEIGPVRGNELNVTKEDSPYTNVSVPNELQIVPSLIEVQQKQAQLSSSPGSGPKLPPGFVTEAHNSKIVECEVREKSPVSVEFKNSTKVADSFESNPLLISLLKKKRHYRSRKHIRTSSSLSSLLLNRKSKNVSRKSTIKSAKRSCDSSLVLITDLETPSKDAEPKQACSIAANRKNEQQILKEAKQAWNIGLQLGLKTNNEAKVIEDLSAMVRREQVP